MCVYSMVMDHYSDKWRRITIPEIPSWPHDNPLTPLSPYVNIPIQPQITQEELDEFKTLLDRARKYDKKNNEPHCENEDKKRLVKELADQLGVNIDFINDEENNNESA